MVVSVVDSYCRWWLFLFVVSVVVSGVAVLACVGESDFGCRFFFFASGVCCC